MGLLHLKTETTTPLGISAVFTGTAIDMGLNSYDVDTFRVTAFSDAASAANGLVIQMSNDSTTWYPAARTALTAGAPVSIETPVVSRYYRVVYTNGAAAQTTFILNSSTR